MMFLETTDDIAILGYAGLGATARGTEPADWMSAVLRGRKLPLEQALAELAGAIRRQFPNHLAQIPKDLPANHKILIPAFVDCEARLYTIHLALAPDRKSYEFRTVRHVVNQPPRIEIAGSGEVSLARDERWIRDLRRLVSACDTKRVSPIVVADQLARINEIAHRNTTDGTVGPRCIVAWRHNKSGTHKGGGGHQLYDSIKREGGAAVLPIIANGMDVQALMQTVMPHMMEQMSARRTGEPRGELDVAKLNAELAMLPDHPDEYLR
jgi:hypothetical protein